MRKLGKRILSLLIVAVLVCTMLPLSASALSGSYGNGTWSDVEGNFYIMKPDGTQEQVSGWKTTITNPGQSFTLWFPNPYYYGSTFSGHLRYTAGEHGTGSFSEKKTMTYYVSTSNLGYEIHLLPTAAELEQKGIVPDTGYKFSHYEITYWNRNSSSSDFTQRTERFNPDDIIPMDVNLRGKYAKNQGYLDVKVIFVEDETAAVTYTLNYEANGGNGAPAAQTATTTAGSHTFTVSSAAPTREGYTFKGWADTADATVAGYLAGDGITLTKDAPNRTIYAVWEAIPAPEYTYTLTYAPNGENVTGMPENQTVTTTAETYDFTVSDATPVREGYTFQGWTDEEGNAVAAGAVITLTMGAPAKTLTAVWEKTDAKVSKPSITKAEDKSSLNGGETVNYTLTSNVPDYLGDYLKLPEVPDPEIVTTNAEGEVVRGSYPLSFYDRLPAGLSFNEDSLTVAIGERVLPADVYTLVKGTEADNFTFRVDLDLVQLYEKGLITMADIEKAEKIYVRYSATLAQDATPGHYVNTAWVGFEGGFSKEANANVDTFGIEVLKYDQSNNKAPLAGAKFQLTDANGKTWEGVSDENGMVYFNALAAGSYTLVELEAPAGYVKNDKPLPIEIVDGDNAPLVIKTEFANAPIPHTGGEGTSMFFILGGTLMGMAIALYMASQKKRSFQA